MDFSLIIPTFIAGILTFLAPCTLPLLPGYLAFISGASFDDLKNPAKARSARRQIFFNGLLFIIGFSLVFIILGSLIGLIGLALAPFRLWLTRVSGVLVIFFGLMMLNVFKLSFFNVERHIKVPSMLKRGTPGSSLLLGSAFGFGWTPCVGPVLGAVLALAATSTTVLQGAFLLFIFSLGLAVPFLVIAAGIGSATKYIEKISPYLHAITIIGGILLVFLGILLLTNNFSALIGYGYRLLQFINYDRLLNYL